MVDVFHFVFVSGLAAGSFIVQVYSLRVNVHA